MRHACEEGKGVLTWGKERIVIWQAFFKAFRHCI